MKNIIVGLLVGLFAQTVVQSAVKIELAKDRQYSGVIRVYEDNGKVRNEVLTVTQKKTYNTFFFGMVSTNLTNGFTHYEMRCSTDATKLKNSPYKGWTIQSSSDVVVVVVVDPCLYPLGGPSGQPNGTDIVVTVPGN